MSAAVRLLRIAAPLAALLLAPAPAWAEPTTRDAAVTTRASRAHRIALQAGVGTRLGDNLYEPTVLDASLRYVVSERFSLSLHGQEYEDHIAPRYDRIAREEQRIPAVNR
jgi:hypothetical protein